MGFELRRQPSGAMAVYHRGLRETMHPGLGPWGEAWALYIAGCHLEEVLQAPPPPRGLPETVVFDVGLGAAATALAALACREGLAREGREPRPLAVISFESDLSAARFALAQSRELGYLAGHEAKLAALLETGSWQGEGLRWELRAGAFPELIQQEPRRADAMFFDPFSPRVNPEMWRLPLLEGLYHCRRPGGVTRLATYSSAHSTRSALLLAGFFVGEWRAAPEARPGTQAATELSALDAPLGGGWLARWRKEKDPWPVGTRADDHRRLREELLGHPQWSRLADAGPQGPNAAALPPPRRRKTSARAGRRPPDTKRSSA